MKKIYALFYRSDVNWQLMNDDVFLRQAELNHSVASLKTSKLPEILKRIKIWNSYFKMNYYQYRHEIKMIAESNKQNVKNLDLIIRNRNILKIPADFLGNTYFLPCDDDDWFSPEVIEKLYLLEDDFIHWSDIKLETTRQDDNETAGFHQYRYRMVNPHDIYTNSYAISTACLKHYRVEVQRNLLNKHYAVARKINHKRTIIKTNSIQNYLSISYKSPASITNMVIINSKRDMTRMCRKLQRKLSLFVDEHTWANEYITKINNLNDRLLNSIIN